MQSEILEGFRLSPQQKRLWFLQQDGSVYRTQGAIILTGELNVEVLKVSAHKIVNRHEILRTTFHRRPGIKIPIQVVAENSTPSWHSINLRNCDHNEQSFRIEKLFQEEKHLLSKLEKGSIWRLTLISLSDNQNILLISLPSLYADNWTLKHLVQEISQTYNLCLQGKELFDEPIQYIQFSEWQNELLDGDDAETGRAYWQTKDIKIQQPIALPFEGKFHESNKFESDIYTLKLPEDLIKKINDIATSHNTSISDFLLSCWYILIYRLTKQTDIVINALFNGRKYEEFYEIIGLLAKWLPVDCTISKESKFWEVLLQISDKLRQVEKYQEYFIEEDSIDLKKESVGLQICFQFEELPEDYYAGGVTFSLYRQYVCFDRFKVKLTCLQKKESLIAEFYYDLNIFSKESIEKLARQFKILVESAVNNPETSVEKLEIIDSKQRDELLFEFNKTQTNFLEDKCIHHLFEEQVEETPDNIAVVFENQQLTYAELNTKANQLAHYLKGLGVGSEVVVGLFVERSLDIITALLGILKVGAVYLPLDTELPAEDLDFRLHDVQASVLLTQQSLLQKLPETALQVICLDADSEIIAQENQTNPQTSVKPENLVYTIFTSGSTGKPKAVAVEHRQLLNYLYAILDRLKLSESASFATVSTFAADLGNTVIFPALCTGGCLHIISQERASDSLAFADYFQHHPIDCLKIVPSHLAALIASSPSQSILPRQCLILGGEVSSWELIEKIQAQAPKCRIFNHYGPTETTVGVLTYEVQNQASSHNSDTVPLGKPLANTQVYVLDEHLQLAPIGVPGELYIGGASLARGYLNRPELTAERFTHNPFISEAKARLYKTGDLVRYLPDGNLEFLGRVDNQVKIRGFRIELGEIEAALRQHSNVQEVVVLATEQTLADKRLVAYIVPTSKNPSSALTTDLRNFCLQKLPKYMLPSAFVFLKTLPLTSNGKINRQALPALEQTRSKLEQLYVAPRTPVEKQLAEIWAKLLGLSQVGIYDNFFELGGHSLLITQLLAKVRKIFQIELPLHNFFNAPTIADLADSIESKQINDTFILNTANVNLKDEAVLDPAICPGTSISVYHQSEPHEILLTGATGFLGVFLLYELLQQTLANIYCLVRAETTTDAIQRLQSHLESYLLWDESFKDRIIPVVGDLSQPLLGLSNEQFRSLANQIDVIYHNGALVNFTYPYSALKAANVLGTQEVLRLATQAKLKPLHFISTIGVVASSGLEIVQEVDIQESGEGMTSGYSQSKWVAEKLVTIARDRGVPVSIYRPGRISGHSITGVCNIDDHTFRMIKGCIQLGSVPSYNSIVNLTPVDYASKAIIYLSKQKLSLGKIFHVVNPQPIYWNEIINFITSFGYPLKQIDYQEWRIELLKAVERSKDNALYPLISIFADSETPKANTEESSQHKFDCQNTLNGLVGTSIICPPVSWQLLSTYFSYLIRSRFLDKPQQ